MKQDSKDSATRIATEKDVALLTAQIAPCYLFKIHYKSSLIAVPLHQLPPSLKVFLTEVLRRFERQCLKGELTETVQNWRTVGKNVAIDIYLQMSATHQLLIGQSVDIQPVFCREQRGRVSLSDFQVLHCIGSGGFSKVYLVRKRSNGCFHAMKLMQKQEFLKSGKEVIVENERVVMGMLDHPFVLKLHYAFQTRRFIAFVTEFCPGGQLFYNLRLVKRLSESDARIYFLQILLGLQHMHEMKVVYRDLKPENIFLDAEGHLKIGDFGLSKPDMERNQLTHTFCGSIEYMPPQMLEKVGHNFTADYYCLGAFLFQVIVGVPPFYSKDKNVMKQAIVGEELSFPEDLPLSRELKDLLQRLLNKNPKYRLGAMAGAKQILGHPWVRQLKSAEVLGKRAEPPIRPNLLKANFEKADIGEDQPEFTAMLLKHQHDTLRVGEQLFPDFYFSCEKELSCDSRQELLPSKLDPSQAQRQKRQPLQRGKGKQSKKELRIETRRGRQQRIDMNLKSPTHGRKRKSKERSQERTARNFRRMKSHENLRLNS